MGRPLATGTLTVLAFWAFGHCKNQKMTLAAASAQMQAVSKGNMTLGVVRGQVICDMGRL